MKASITDARTCYSAGVEKGEIANQKNSLLRGCSFDDFRAMCSARSNPPEDASGRSTANFRGTLHGNWQDNTAREARLV